MVSCEINVIMNITPSATRTIGPLFLVRTSPVVHPLDATRRCSQGIPSPGYRGMGDDSVGK